MGTWETNNVYILNLWTRSNVNIYDACATLIAIKFPPHPQDTEGEKRGRERRGANVNVMKINV